MKNYINKFLKSKYGKWILALCVVASGGTVTFQMLSPDKPTNAKTDTVIENVLDNASDVINLDELRN